MRQHILYIGLALLSMLCIVLADPTIINNFGTPILFQKVEKGAWSQYQVNVADLPAMQPTDYLFIVATPVSGDADICISKAGVPGSIGTDCTWIANTAGQDIVRIQRSDPNWPQTAFFIGIYGETRVAFNLNVWKESQDTQIVLTEGMPQFAMTERGGYVYFKYTLQSDQDFFVSVTSTEGDPDLYISTTDPKPTQATATWKARNWGHDYITIAASDPNFKPYGTYYIGIHGYIDAEFSIHANAKSNYTILLEGLPVTNYINRTEYGFFKFYQMETEPNMKQTWEVTPLNSFVVRSDPDLYVKKGSDSYAGEPKPGRSNYDFSSIRSTGADIITFVNDKEGWTYASVYGFTAADFKITAGTEYKNTLVTDGEEYAIMKDGPSVSYFKYIHGDDESDLVFSASTDDSEVTLDLFVSMTSSHPTSDKAEIGIGQRIGLSTFLVKPAPTTKGTYFIAIQNSAACNFTFSAATNQSHVLLTLGEVSPFNFVPAGYFRYFYLDHPDMTTDLSIVVNPWQGNVDLYVSNTTQRPGPGNYTWRSINWKQDTVVIHPGDLQPYKTRVYIGVYAPYYDSYFAIAAYSGNTALQLIDGDATGGRVSPNNYRNFKLRVKTPGSVTVNLELMDKDNTDANIYAGCFENPTSLHYTWKSVEIGNDVLEIDYVYCTDLYISVQGRYGPATPDSIVFTLTARRTSANLIVNRASIMETVRAKTSLQFTAYMYSADYVFITATLLAGRTRMYVTSNDTNPAGPNNYMWMSDSWPGNAIIVPKTDPNYRTGRWRFSVESVDIDSTFYIHVGIKPYVTSFVEGVPTLTPVPANDFINFGYTIPYTPSRVVPNDYLLSIRGFTGPTEFRCSFNRFNESDYFISSTGWNDRVVVLPKEKLRQGPIFIRIFGRSRDNSNSLVEFTLNRDSNPTILVQDQQLLHTTKLNTLSFFKLLGARFQSTDRPYTVTVESCDPKRAPETLGSATNSQPSRRTNYTANSIAVNAYVSEMSFNVPHGSELYFVSVSGQDSDNSYTDAYSIYTTTLGSRPIIASTKFNVIADKDGKRTVRAPVATHPSTLVDVKMKYSVFAVELNENKPYESINFFTSCGMMKYGTWLGGAQENTVQNYQDIPLNTYPTKGTYLINVLVHDGFGLYGVYDHGWIVDGAFSNSRPSSYERTFFSPLSPGFFILLFSFIGIIAYFVIGMIVQAVRGKRGKELVPNVTFWADLPFLIADGVKLIISPCVKRATYKQFQDESGSDSVNTSGFSASAVPAKPASVGGYGSI